MKPQRLIRKVSIELLHDNEGAILPFFALLLPIILGMIGLAVDVGGSYMQRQNMQHAADSAAIAGRLALTSGQNAGIVGKATAGKLGFSSVAINCAATSCDAPISATTSAYSANPTAVQAVVTKSRSVPFASYFNGAGDWQIVTRATVITNPNAANYCILVLGVGTAAAGSCNGGSGAFSGGGNFSYGTPDCGTAVNSNASDAVAFTGSSATANGSMEVCGGLSANRNLLFQQTPITDTGAAVLDPYVGAIKTWVTGTTAAAASLNDTSLNTVPKKASGPLKFDTVSSGTTVSGSGKSNYTILDLSGGTLDGSGGGNFYIDTLSSGTVQHGVFYVNNLAASGNVTSRDATIVLMTNTSNCGSTPAPCSTVAGNPVIDLQAPTSTSTSAPNSAGIALTSPYAYKLSTGGNVNLKIQGAIYFPVTAAPGSLVSVSGVSSNCAQIIAARVQLNGNVNLATGNCGITNITGAPGYAQAVE